MQSTGKPGYKWIRDRMSEVFIVELITFNETIPNDGTMHELRTTDCIVNKISRFRNGSSINKVGFSAFYPFVFSVGMHITGTEISYCPTIGKLMESQGAAIKYALYLHDKNTNGAFDRADPNSMFGRYFRVLIDLPPRKGTIPGLTGSVWRGITPPKWL